MHLRLLIQLPNSKWRPYIKTILNKGHEKIINKSQGKMKKILEKSGNFVRGKKWEP